LGKVKASLYEDIVGPSWFLSMEEFLDIVVPVVMQKQSMYTGKWLKEKGHPEDLMIIVTDIVETVALTLVAIGPKQESQLNK
jgi:hypothetical protein